MTASKKLTMSTLKRLEKTEALLKQCQQDVQRLEKIQKEIKTIEKRRKQLDNYYENRYLKDIDLPKKFQNYGILDEDSIWNVLTDQYGIKIKLLKILIKSI